MRTVYLWGSMLMALLAPRFTRLAAEERHENFDRDPGWEGRNHRSATPEARTVRQDFGYSATHHAGGKTVGELGGFITPAAEPAYYARRIPARTFADTLAASGRLACTGRQFHALIGFFNADTANEWRTPSTIVLRLYGRGEVFYAYVEYATRRWRAGGDSPRPFARIRQPGSASGRPRGFASGGVVHDWSLEYDPGGNDGGGTITATLDGETSVCHLDPGHKADGAVFNRFGLLNVMKHADDGGELWLDDVTVDGETEHFTADPGWDQHRNRRTYTTNDVRPRFDFGYSATRHAGGERAGELGGSVFRGDCRYGDRMACYADRLGALTLKNPLRASGKVCLRRGVTDSTTLLGFFHSAKSMTVSKSQASAIPENFLGIAVEGPSREGFCFYPAYHVDGGGRGSAAGAERPHILPDGAAHDWTLEYAPAAAGGKGRITVSLDGKSIHIDLPPDHLAAGARFDRFGIITTWIDGNGQNIYFDDLTYTRR
ncbi:MAG: hypothetical protein O7J95_00530 [Planctomycetota bacterium]|nr:hypothetical protein [Planctomycetota bacterium]